jgi:hypothetical protein
MTFLRAFFVVLGLSAFHLPAFAKAVTVTSKNLDEYLFDYTNHDRDCWRTTLVVSGTTYTVNGCAGSQTDATMVNALEQVYRSPIQEQCEKEKYCEFGRCRVVYGQRELSIELKVITNAKNQVQNWVQRELYTPCL